jgi:hypothetical protein
MNKTLIFVLMMLLTTGANAAEAGQFLATTKDKTVSDLIKRWATIDGHFAKWEATVDYPINDAEALNDAARLNQAKNIRTAFDRVANFMFNEPNVGVPLFACNYDGNISIVVRSAGQPECNKPLN